MTGKQNTIKSRHQPNGSATASSVRSTGSRSAATPATQRRTIVIGPAAEIPRALEHPAIAMGRLVVDAILTIDADADDVQEVGTRLLELFREHRVDALLVAGPVGRQAMRVIADLALIRPCELLAVMPTEILADHDPVVMWTGDSPVIQLARVPGRGWHMRVKRAADVIGAAIGLILVAPLLAILAAMICIESRGAPLFEHERVGHRGRRFKCLKLRTMRQGSEDILRNDPALYEEYRQNHFKIPEDRDPRTTTLGRFLRETSLDELPQLWNVLRGDMSLVGPRPVVEDELAMYGNTADLLLSVPPGITGAWAVSGRHDVGYPERCAVELSYIRNWRLSEDLRIALRTVKVVSRVQWH